MANHRWIFIIIFLIILFFAASVMAGIISLFIDTEEPITCNVVVIPIKGVILSDKASLFDQQSTSSKDIIGKIKRADDSEHVQAIVFEINSPGGTVVASEEIVNAIKKTSKPTVSYIREVGASGAYWVASATDQIFASRMSITGSIGVIASYLQFSGFIERYNITYQRLTAGKYKDIGSPFKELTYDEKVLFQGQLDLIHDYFIKDVAESRNLSEESIKEIETARLFLGIEAKEVGLIDEFGSRDEVIKYLKKELNTTITLQELTQKQSFFEMLGEVLNEKSFFIGQGIGNSLINAKPTNSLSIWS
ncbi:MAG: signal peptide peptidase SppA [Nanoarchaeota archaeon]